MTSNRWIKGRLNNNGFTLNRMIYLSLFLHAVVLSILFLSPPLPSSKWTFGPVYSVQLVSFSESFLSRKNVMATSGEFNERITTDHPFILKKRLDTVSPVPEAKAESHKRDLSSVEKALENIRQKISSTSPMPSLTQNQPSDAEINVKMKGYYSTIWARIKSQWVLPQSILPRGNIEAVIHAKISRNGAVTDLGFEKRSGNRYFDDSAMKSIRKASPLTPLPEWIRGDSIEIGIRFHSSELR